MQDPTAVVLYTVGALALVGGIIYLARLAEQKRAAALADAALRMGFAFEARLPPDRLEALGRFHLFERGHSRRARYVIRGKSSGADVVLLDYQYTTGGGKNSHTWRQTVAIYPGAATGLPVFTLSPENILEKVGSLFGYQDIDFEASEEFSKHYLLRGADESAIRAAFGADALSYFAHNRGWSVDSAGGALAVYRSGKRCKPEEIQPFLAETWSVGRALARR
jgi:hypothetical protein